MEMIAIRCDNCGAEVTIKKDTSDKTLSLYTDGEYNFDVLIFRSYGGFSGNEADLCSGCLIDIMLEALVALEAQNGKTKET